MLDMQHIYEQPLAFMQHAFLDSRWKLQIKIKIAFIDFDCMICIECVIDFKNLINTSCVHLHSNYDL